MQSWGACAVPLSLNVFTLGLKNYSVTGNKMQGAIMLASRLALYLATSVATASLLISLAHAKPAKQARQMNQTKQEKNEIQSEFPVPENEAKTHYMLGIIAYNYTDDPIAAFSIDGADGGHVRLSSPTSGGSGTSCCVLLSKNPVWPMQVLVRWQVGGCRVYDEDRRSGHSQYYYKELITTVERGNRTHPSDIAVHFFKDGSVRVTLSDGWDPPLVKLQKNRAIEKKFSECKPGETAQYL